MKRRDEVSEGDDEGHEGEVGKLVGKRAGAAKSESKNRNYG